MNPWQQPPGQPNWGQPPSPYGAPLGPPTGQSSGPSGRTAIAAVVLSFLGCAFSLVYMGFCVIVAADTGDSAAARFFGAVSGLTAFSVALGLLVGGIMLARRRLPSRAIITAACLVTNFAVIGTVIWTRMQTTGNNDGPEMVAVVSGFALIPIIASVSTIACAFTDATRQWCLAAPPTPPPPQTNPWYPPHPG